MRKPCPCYSAMPSPLYSVFSLDDKFLSDKRFLDRTCYGNISLLWCIGVTDGCSRMVGGEKSGYCAGDWDLVRLDIGCTTVHDGAQRWTTGTWYTTVYNGAQRLHCARWCTTRLVL